MFTSAPAPARSALPRQFDYAVISTLRTNVRVASFVPPLRIQFISQFPHPFSMPTETIHDSYHDSHCTH